MPLLNKGHLAFFFQALAVENVQDFRPFLRRYKGMTADEVGREYNLRVSEAKVLFFFIDDGLFWEWLSAL